MKSLLNQNEFTFRLFHTSVFFVHFWAILSFLVAAPGSDVAFGISETLGLGSYVLIFALLESILLIIGLAGIS